MEIETSHKIYYSNKKHVPLTDIAESLLALEKIIQQSPSVLEKIFPGAKIQGVEVYLNELKSGSLYEDIVIKLIFGNQEKFDQFIENIREKIGLNHLSTNSQILSALILILTLMSVSYVLGKSKSSSERNQNIIETNINIIVGEGAEMLQISPNELRVLIESGIPDQNELARNAIKFIGPAKKDSEASITFDQDPKLSISSDSITAFPAYILESEQAETIEDFDQIEVSIRATDLDSFKRGWGAIVPKIHQRRVRLQLDPHIKAEGLMQHPTLLGNITAVFNFNEKGERIPVLYFLREIHEFLEE